MGTRRSTSSEQSSKPSKGHASAPWWVRFPCSAETNSTTGDDRSRQQQHRKTTGNRTTLKPALPRLTLHVSTDVVVRSDDGAVGLDRSRALFTIEDKVLLTGVDLLPVQVELVGLLAHAPRLARLLARVVRGPVSDPDAFREARALIDALPFEVTP